MADRDIIIGGSDDGEGGLPIRRGTSVKDSLEPETDNVKCFDETVPQGSATVGGTLEIEKLGYDSAEDYIALRDKLKEMLSVPTMITTYETIRFKDDDPYVIQKNYKNCILDSRDYEMNPDEHAVLSLKFIYAEVDEKDPVPAA